MNKSRAKSVRIKEETPGWIGLHTGTKRSRVKAVGKES